MTEKLLSEITTAQVGGPARTYIRATTEAEIVEAVSSADAANEPVLIVGGGSNLLVSDAGFDGTVVHIASTGVEELPIPACGGANVRVQAGTVWDDFVQLSIEKEWSGPAALSGIPGTVGATPVQNVGAYGVEVSEFIASVRTWDRETGKFKTFANADLRFGYRDSILKHMVNGSPRYVVLTVDFQFKLGSLSSPIKYGELAKSLGVQVGKRAESALVRDKVLALRASKGMVLDASDRDTFSTGSFFTNPIVPVSVLDSLPEDAPRFPVVTRTGVFGTEQQESEEYMKLSAAWLIQHAGFEKGFGLEGDAREIAGGRASLSTKHTLAITNRGDATAEDIFAIARAVRAGVSEKFGVELVPEPVVVNGKI